MKRISQRPVHVALKQRPDARKVGLAAAVLVAGLLFNAGHARAESTMLNAAGTASAHLNFAVIIPTFLYLQVGTGTPFATNAAIDTVTFDMTGAVSSIGSGAPQAGTGGDLLAGSVTARVLGNHFTAAVNLSATTTGAMSNGTDTISWSEISIAAPTAIVVVPAAASTLNHPGSLAAPLPMAPRPPCR